MSGRRGDGMLVQLFFREGTVSKVRLCWFFYFYFLRLSNTRRKENVCSSPLLSWVLRRVAFSHWLWKARKVHANRSFPLLSQISQQHSIWMSQHVWIEITETITILQVGWHVWDWLALDLVHCLKLCVLSRKLPVIIFAFPFLARKAPQSSLWLHSLDSPVKSCDLQQINET